MYSRFLFNAEIIKQFHMAHHFHMTSAQAIVLHKALTGCCFPVIIWFTTPSKYNQYHTLLLSQLFAPTFQLSRKLSIVIYTVIPCYTYNKAQLKTWGLHNSRFFFTHLHCSTLSSSAHCNSREARSKGSKGLALPKITMNNG